MPRKKLSDCTEHTKMMKVLKARLIEISLKVENYIYKQKPISKLQAKAFLNEISSYKSHCQNDIGYIQVIDKLTKYMNIITSNNTDDNPVKDINLNAENTEFPKNTTLASTSDIFSATVDVVSTDLNQDLQNKIHNATDNQNNLGFTLHNQSTSGTESSGDKNIKINQNCDNILVGKSYVNEAVDLEKVTDISSEVFEGVHIECHNGSNPPQTENKAQGEIEDDNKPTTNKLQKSQLDNKVQKTLKNNYRLLICVDGGVIHEIKHVAPKLTIPLNAFVLNNTKNPNNLPEPNPKVIQNNVKISSEEKNVPLIDKSDTKKIYNKIVKFTAPYNDVTKISIDKKSNDNNNTDKKFASTTLDRSGINKHKKQRTNKKEVNKNKQDNKIKETQGKNSKSKNPAIKSKVIKLKNIITNNLPKVKSSNNESNQKSLYDLSWLDSIQYMRKVDAKEYFKPQQPLDEDFWNYQNLLTSNERDFNM